MRNALGPYVQCIVLEPRYNCKDFRNLFTHFYSKKFQVCFSDCSRLHFFKKRDINVSKLLTRPDMFQDDYLGFSVIRPVPERCLGRTILDPYKIGLSINDQFYVLRTAFTVQINGAKLVVEGYPYTSQDTDATLCAQSALWGVCRFLSEKYRVYKELYPYDFIRMTEPSQGRTVPYRGMTYTDYCKILSDFGTFPVFRVLQRSNGWDSEAFDDLCAYVESGFPVLASLRGIGHVVSIIGHTLDYNKSVSSGEFISSSNFLKRFIVIDDNFSPYALLGYDGDPENYGDNYGEKVSIKNIHTITCPLPEKVFLPAKDARAKAMKLCNMHLKAIKATGTGPYVTRLFVTTNSSFKKRKLDSVTKTGRSDKASTLITNLHLPHFIWVMEIAPLEIYKAYHCTVEIVLDATSRIHPDDGHIYTRIGNELIFAAEDQSIIKKAIGSAPIKFPQYTHNLGERSLN